MIDSSQQNNSLEDLVVTLEPFEPDPNKLAGEDRGVIETLLGKQNQIRLGKPRFTNYIATLLAQSSKLSPDIEQHVRRGYDFQHVITSLTLLPDKDCRFVSVDFSIELFATPKVSNEPLTGRAIVYDLKPQEKMREITYQQQSKTGFEVGAEVQGGLSKLLAKVTRENSLERNGVWYVRELYGYGINFSEAGWRLLANSEYELAGDIRNLELIVQVPANAKLEGRFRVTAEIGVKVAFDNWLTKAFFPQKNNPILDVLYTLSD